MSDLSPEALDYLVRLGRNQLQETRVSFGVDKPHLLLPEGVKAVDISDWLPTPARVEADPQFVNAESFAEYVNRFKTGNTLLFSSRGSGRIRAEIDYHAPDGTASWCDHSATLVLTKSEEWNAWTAKNEKQLSQIEFAEFLEDQNHCIIEPDAAKMVEIALNLKSTVDVTFESRVNVQTGGSTFVYKEDVKSADAHLTMPNLLCIALPPFVDEKPIYMAVRLRYRINGGKPTFFYRLDRRSRVIDQAVAAVNEKVAQLTGLPVMVGP